jgi:hypothetical protein
MTDVGRPAPEVYRLSMEKLPLAVGRAWRLSLLKLVIATTAVIAALTPLAPTRHDAVDVALVLALVSVVALPYVVWRAGRRVRRHWNAFELAIGADTIRVAAKGEGRVTIRRDQVTRIVEGGMGLVVHSAEPGVVIHVPRTVESYLDARARLAALRPIERRINALGWCVASVASGGALLAAAPFWLRAPGIGGGLVLCQAAFAVFAAFEIAAHPGLGRRVRGAAIVAVALAGLVPLAGFMRL